MKNIYILLTVVAALAFTGMASAQNLDPTVVVDRAYEGKLMEVHKPALEMSVPDSVMRLTLISTIRSLTVHTRVLMSSIRIFCL